MPVNATKSMRFEGGVQKFLSFGWSAFPKTKTQFSDRCEEVRRLGSMDGKGRGDVRSLLLLLVEMVLLLRRYSNWLQCDSASRLLSLPRAVPGQAAAIMQVV